MVDIAKAGWLFRESSFLKRWKKHWFSLSVDGYLRQFDSENDYIAKKTIHVPTEVIAIKVGSEAGTKAPTDLSMDFLLKLITKDDPWILCCESIDDLLAWQMALEQARVMNNPQQQQNRMGNLNSMQQMPAYLQDVLVDMPEGTYPMYYRGRYNGNHYSRIVHTNQGPITVVYVNDPYYYRRGCGYGGYGALAATSLLLTPFWFPFFWC